MPATADVPKQGSRFLARFLPSQNRSAQLDFVRGIAILAVMEYHFLTVPVQNPAARWFEFVGKRIGWMGVDLFFVLSGFLVGGLLVQELLKSQHLRVKRFLIRRALKIWPAYYVYILFQIVTRKHPISTFAWQNLLNIQNYAGTSLNHTWSLAVEEHFYLALPPILYLLYKNPLTRRHIALILALICVLVLIGRIVTVYALGWGDPQWLTHARIDSLLSGVILSWVFYSQRAFFDRMIHHRIVLGIVALAGPLFALTQDGHHSPPMWSFGYTLNYLSLGSLFLLIYQYRGRFTDTFLYKSVALIGVYSYGIYLWHLSVREPLAKFVSAHAPESVRWGTLLIAQYVAAILLGILMTQIVEFPMLRLRDRIFPRGQAHLAPSEP